MIHILLNKTLIILALQLESAKYALVELTTLLNRDTTPTITPLQVVPAPQASPSVAPVQPPPILPSIQQHTPEECLLEYHLKQQVQQRIIPPYIQPLVPSPATFKGAQHHPLQSTSKGARNPPPTTLPATQPPYLMTHPLLTSSTLLNISRSGQYYNYHLKTLIHYTSPHQKQQNINLVHCLQFLD